jgi:hypothetical protein
MTTWYRTTNIFSAGQVTTVAAAIANLYSFFLLAEAETPFGWQIASYSNVAPVHLMLKRKDGSPGRLMFYGGTAPLNTTCILPIQGQNTTTFIWVAYDPTFTADSPLGSYATVNPMSVASSLGTCLAHTQNTQLSAHNLRAYSSDDGQLFLHAYETNAKNGYLTHVGKIFRAASGETTTYEGLCVKFYDASTISTRTQDLVAQNNNFSPANMFGNPDLSSPGNTSLQTARSYCSAYINGAWYRINRFTGQIFFSYSLIDSANKHHFIPVIWQVTPDHASVLPALLKSKNLAAGPRRTVNTVIVDNQGVTRGYYIGYHGTPGSDEGAITLLNDDM